LSYGRESILGADGSRTAPRSPEQGAFGRKPLLGYSLSVESFLSRSPTVAQAARETGSFGPLRTRIARAGADGDN